MHRPRFIVRENEGHRINLNSPTMARDLRLITEVMVIDRDYCHKVVWSSESTVMRHNERRFQINRRGQPKRWRNKVRHATARSWPLTRKREYAERLAAELNAKDEAWMAANV